jgi:cbb3-type cytochrome oxidase subunit 3
MINKLLGKVNDVDQWLIASLFIFALFFIGVLVHLVSMRKKHIETLKNIPFNEK